MGEAGLLLDKSELLDRLMQCSRGIVKRANEDFSAKRGAKWHSGAERL